MPRYLGQHFLNNPQIAEQIIQSANIQNNETILEIGPGEGFLTEKIYPHAKKVIAIELDNKLKETLEEKFKSNNKLEIIFDDILKVNLPKLLAGKGIDKYKVIANIPYYITSKIIRLFLESSSQPDELILMIQKEVAERIVSNPGQMSILSASVQYYAQVEILFNVTKENFNPPPQVDSSVIRIFNIKKTDPEEDTKFFRVVRAGFCARRKTLVNNLSNSFHLSKREVEKIISQISLSSNVRAQELSIENWKKLANLF